MSNRPRADILNIGFFDWNGDRLLNGGAERYISDLCDLLIAAGYCPRLIQNARSPFQRRYRDIEVVGAVVSEDFDLARMATGFAPLTEGAALVIASPVELASQVPDGPRVIGINHGVWWDHPSHRAAWFDTARHETLLTALRRAAICVCVDTNFINWLRTFDGESLERLEYVPNYVDRKAFRQQAIDFTAPVLSVLYPRRLCAERGIFEVIAAFERLFAANGPFELRICGSGTPEMEAQVEAFRSRHPGRVQWTPATMDEMPTMYRESHVVAIPTLCSEGTSLACLEAMATGNAIVATHVGGLPNLIIDGFNGALIRPGAEALTTALLRLADDRAQLAAMAFRATEVSASFSIERWQARWRRIIGEVECDTPQPDSLESAEPPVGTSQTPRTMLPECCGLVRDLASVILPVYNGARLIENAIRSVLAQTYQFFELIIVDDGSTDDVQRVLDRYANHPKVRIFTQPNLGLPGALNQGFAQARGEFWTWVSADNLMAPRQLECLTAKLRSTPDLGMTFADYWVIDDRGNPLADRSWRTHNRPQPLTGEVRLPRTTEKLNGVSDNFIGPCFLYRGWIGRLLGDYDPAQGVEDYDYWMRINGLFSIEHLGTDDLLYWYRVHQDSLSAHEREHAIVEKVAALMHTEQIRAAYFARDVLLSANHAAAGWLALRGIQTTTELTAMATGTDELPALSVRVPQREKSPPQSTRVDLRPQALIFPGSDVSPYDHVAELCSPETLVVVTNQRDAARVRALARVPVIDGESACLGPALRAFARDRGFWNRLHSGRPPSSVQARQMIHFDQPIRLLLQVERLMHSHADHDVVNTAIAMLEIGFRVTILVRGPAGDEVERAVKSGLEVAMRRDLDTDEAYGDWLRQNQFDAICAFASPFGAATAATCRIPFMQILRHQSELQSSTLASGLFEADAATAAYAFASLEVARYADLVVGLDPAKFRCIDHRLDGHEFHGDRCTMYAQTLRGLLRRQLA